MEIAIRQVPEDFWDRLPGGLDRPCEGEAFEIVRNAFVQALRPFGRVGPLEEFESSTQQYVGVVDNPDFYILDDNLYGKPIVRLEGGERFWTAEAIRAVAVAADEAGGMLVVALGDCGFYVTPNALYVDGARLESVTDVEQLVAAMQ